MVARNDVTGDAIVSRPSSKAFEAGYDAIDWSAHRSETTDSNDVASEVADMERDCCGTFKGSPHRSTCPNYLGKFKAAAQKQEGGDK